MTDAEFENLRDQFAAGAMAAIMRNRSSFYQNDRHVPYDYPTIRRTVEGDADMAYRVADAMLVSRTKSN